MSEQGSNLFKGKIAASGEKQSDAARIMGISLSRFNAKLNNTGGAQFTQGEIGAAKDH